ncbi:MAG: hypothetical protein AVDCRST_MAG73-2046 [uncultured Thermomicrobiales bacterium]|uniref:Uncharacterized protein n=1 Tax=uncultured Thermomicrobiales bacterium TaxID=1645740 RepID=A0A6J4U959_9BACT|nr:MAG: hypothetical protein AVDCRST_MAG73-2046 [uncultured Thermomicrobiales bacterium]
MSVVTSARAHLIRWSFLGVAGAVAFGGASALAKHEDLEFPAAIHAGTCDEPGDVVLQLDDLVRLPEDAPEEGDRAGAPGSQVVHGLPEDAEFELTIEDLFADDHILAVFDAEGETIVACGPIGAYTYDEGNDLVIGLRSQEDSPYSGVALFESGDDDAVDLSIYLVNNTPAPAATPAA